VVLKFPANHTLGERMNARRIAAGLAVALLGGGLAACGGSSGGNSGSSSAPPTTQAAPASSSPAAPASSAPATGGGGTAGLTRPGTSLGFGAPATVGWVPPSQDLGSGAHKGYKLKVAVLSVQKGTIADFANIDLSATEKKDTPYYVKVRVTALENAKPAARDDPAIAFTAIDDRGQEQSSITFIGTFARCDETNAPKPFTAGKSYTACFTYLMPGGGSIQKVDWNNGPAGANEVTPYFDKPIVWAG
jgi:hypothetical protein